jgi:alpha-D-xyloside xylohydrolase
MPVRIETFVSGVRVRSAYETVQIETWGTDSMRVRATVGPAIREDWPGALLPAPDTTPQITVENNRAIINNGKLTALLSPDGHLSFHRTEDNTELVSEDWGTLPWALARQYTSVSGDNYHIEYRLRAYAGERLFGMGQHQHGKLDQKGCVIDLVQKNTEVNIPFLHSSRGYGFLWNNPAVGRAEFATNGTRWTAEATPQIDYWITAGDTPAAIAKHYADAVGHPRLLPEWAAGFWQCKLRYHNQETLLEVAREHRRRGHPLSVIVADFFHWTHQGDWQFDPRDWPDPAAMVQELDEMGVKLMVSIWPSVNPASPNFDEMAQLGLLVRNERGLFGQFTFADTEPRGPVNINFYDATNPTAREYIWNKVREGYYQHGIKVWWLDACEPETYPVHPDHQRYHLGNGQSVANIYPLLHAQGFYDGMRSEGESEIILLCRSVWAGSQRYGAALWSGDIPSTFEALQTQVRAGLNAAMSGIPWWTTDIGGFHGGDIHSAYFRELIVRWFQYGLFCPLFRLHGYREPATEINGLMVGAANEIWSFGEDAYNIISDLLLLRERLRPYIMDQMRFAHETGTPPMRPLFYDYADDPVCWEIEDQFLFGPDLLVAPILDEGARSRQVYLPAGSSWTDPWDSTRYDGGQWLTVAAPLNRIPLFTRDGVQLPIRAG